MGYDFKGKKFLTRGVDNSIPIQVQLYLWRTIEGLLENQVGLDYLQIFNIRKEGHIIVITHSQEQPGPFELEYVLTDQDIEKIDLNDTKLYIIDNIDHCIMLLATEY